MRFLHTADWHLGRLFHGVHLTDDQAHVLDQLVQLVRDERIPLVVVSGDVYDRAVPPAEAVALLDDTLARLVDAGAQVLLIAGNHDSPERLGFAGRLLRRAGVHVYGFPDPSIEPLVFEDEDGPVAFLPVPFAEPSVVRERYFREPAGDGDPQDDEPASPGRRRAHDHAWALGVAIEALARRVSPDARAVLVAHAATLGGLTSDSERPLSIGGSAAVPTELFQGFHYAALGHLHRPQYVSFRGIQYAGSLLKYSFDEADHRKVVKLVELRGQGRPQVEDVPLVPRHDVRRLEGTLQEVLALGREDPHPDDYVAVTLTDPRPVFDAVGRLREAWPNVLHVERRLGPQGEQARTARRRGLSDEELFSDFYERVNGEPLDAEQRELIREALRGLDPDLAAPGSPA